jgi:hypothetical protein
LALFLFNNTYDGNILPFGIIHSMTVTRNFLTSDFYCHPFFPFEIYGIIAKYVEKTAVSPALLI